MMHETGKKEMNKQRKKKNNKEREKKRKKERKTEINKKTGRKKERILGGSLNQQALNYALNTLLPQQKLSMLETNNFVG
jgi:hypothetical protein